MSHVDTAGFLLLIALWAALYLYHFPYFGLPIKLQSVQQNSRSFNGSWYPPNKTQTSDLEAVINGTDVFGFVFSDAYNNPSPNNANDGINWCNMPHIHSETYPVPPTGYTLDYVEVVRTSSYYLTRRRSMIAQGL